MGFIVFKYAVTAFIIVLVSEIAKRSGKIGALISSLPLVTIMVMLWIFFEQKDTKRIAVYAYYTLWYVLPTLPMFAIMPFMLNRGVNFWITLLTAILVTFISFVITAFICRRFGIELF